MIQLGRFDELGSGVRNINKYLPLYAGGAKPVFRDTTYGFELTVPLIGLQQQATPEVTGEVTGEVTRLLLAMKGEMKRLDMQKALGLKHEDHFREAYLLPAIQLGFLKMTIPDKPPCLDGTTKNENRRLSRDNQQF